VLDGARIEETFAEEADYGQGWSDAHGGPTTEMMPRTLLRVLPTGTVARDGYATGVTITTPAHGDLLTGRRERFLPLGHAEGVGHYHLHYPTLHERIRQVHSTAADSAWIIGNTAHLTSLTYSHYPDLGSELAASEEILRASDTDAAPFSDDDGQSVHAARARLAAGARMVLANLHRIDRAGHTDPTGYADAVAQADAPVAEFHRWLSRHDELGDDTLLLILADHGRDRFVEVDTPWANHGCHCSGCREIPMFLWGPGVRRDAELHGPVIIEDLTSTAAWLMGVSMPYSTGLVLTDALEGDPAVAQRSGEQRASADGTLLATQRWHDDRYHRSSVEVDGEPISSDDALHAEEPRVARTAGRDFACWRELELDEASEHWPWQLSCATRDLGGEWSDLGFPGTIMWPYVSPAMHAPDRDTLLMVYDNVGVTEREQSVTAEKIGLYLSRWTHDEGWEHAGAAAMAPFFPTEPTLAEAADGTTWVAFTASHDEPTSRYTRRIHLFALDWPVQGVPSWEPVHQMDDQDATGSDHERQGNPALVAQEGELRIAWHGYDDEGVHLLATTNDDPRDPASWGKPRAVDRSGRVFGHISPLWDSGGTLYWARAGEGSGAQVCRSEHQSWVEDCLELDGPWIDSLAVVSGSLVASVSTGDGLWEIVELSWPD